VRRVGESPPGGDCTDRTGLQLAQRARIVNNRASVGNDVRLVDTETAAHDLDTIRV
jgi:hypothetical protein